MGQSRPCDPQMVRQLDDPGIISGPHVNTMSALTPKGTCGSAIAMSANGQKQTQLQNKGSACNANSSANVVWQADKNQHCKDHCGMRNAASLPFHSFDCHIAKYSPAMTMKPKNQRAKPTINPATAQTLERLKTSAGALESSKQHHRAQRQQKGGQPLHGDDQRIGHTPNALVGNCAMHQCVATEPSVIDPSLHAGDRVCTSAVACSFHVFPAQLILRDLRSHCVILWRQLGSALLDDLHEISGCGI